MRGPEKARRQRLTKKNRQPDKTEKGTSNSEGSREKRNGAKRGSLGRAERHKIRRKTIKSGGVNVFCAPGSLDDLGSRQKFSRLSFICATVSYFLCALSNAEPGQDHLLNIVRFQTGLWGQGLILPWREKGKRARPAMLVLTLACLLLLVLAYHCRVEIWRDGMSLYGTRRRWILEEERDVLGALYLGSDSAHVAHSLLL